MIFGCLECRYIKKGFVLQLIHYDLLLSIGDLASDYLATINEPVTAITTLVLFGNDFATLLGFGLRCMFCDVDNTGSATNKVHILLRCNTRNN